jgi:hypothetical protein
VAMNCCVSPLATVTFAGVTAIDTSVCGVTVRVAVLLVTPAIAAVILLGPVPTPVANPLLVIVATPVADELHAAVPLRLAVVESV